MIESLNQLRNKLIADGKYTDAADEVLLKNEYSVISAGTERAWIIGQSNNPGQHFPFYPGYSASGYVAAAGSEVTNLKAGELEEKYAKRVVSRLFTQLVQMRFIGKDVRQLKRQREMAARK